MKPARRVAVALVPFVVGLQAQTVRLQSKAVFDLGTGLEWNRSDQVIQSVILPTSAGITYAVIQRAPMLDPTAAFVSGDTDGRIRKSTDRVFYFNAGPLTLLPSPNGNIWCVVGGESASIWLDLYNPSGARIKSGLHVAGSKPLRRIVAAGNDEIVFYSLKEIHFDSVNRDRLREVSVVPIRTAQGNVPTLSEKVAIPILSANGDLVFVNRTSGDLLIFYARTKTSAIINLKSPQRISAAAADSEFFYLLREDLGTNGDATVLKVDGHGHICATYVCETSGAHGGSPRLLGVARNALYVADLKGRGSRFSLP